MFVLKTPIHVPKTKLGFGGEFGTLNGQQYKQNPKRVQSCASLHCLSHQVQKPADQSHL